MLNMRLVEDTPTGRLIFNIMTSFAEFKRNMIVELTQEGKAIARLDPNFKKVDQVTRQARPIMH